MTFVRANPPGWALFELLTSAQMNTIDSQMPFALDGQAGGSYTPAGSIVLDGGSIPNPDFLLDLTAGPGGAIHIDAADPAADVSGIHIECSDNTEAMRIEPVGPNINVAFSVQQALTVIGHSNDGTGGGGGAITALGGAAVGGGFGGAAISATGGNGVAGGASAIAGFGGDQGGIGVFGQGGEPGAYPFPNDGTGVMGIGGDTAAGILGGIGVYGEGGASGQPAISGSGGYFVGKDEATGLQGYADAGNFFARGVFGEGDWAGVYGSGRLGTNGVGILGIGDGSGYGGGFSPGGSTSIAILCAGSIDFDPAGASDKNPAASVAINNELYAKGIVKAWGYVEDGVLVDGYNITSVAIQATANTLNVTMAGAMSSTDYFVVTATTDGWGSNTPRLITCNKEVPAAIGSNINRTTTVFQLRQYGAISGNSVDMTDSEFGFIVMGVHS